MKTCHYCHAYYRGAHCEACMTPTGQPRASATSFNMPKCPNCGADMKASKPVEFTSKSASESTDVYVEVSFYCEKCTKPAPCVGDSIVYPGDPNVYIILAVDFAPDGKAIAQIFHEGTTHEVSVEWVEIDDLQEVQA